MAIQFQGTTPAAFEGKHLQKLGHFIRHPLGGGKVHFEGLKQDTISFGAGEEKIVEAAKGFFPKIVEGIKSCSGAVVDFVKKYGGKIIDFIKTYAGKAKDLVVGLFKKAPIPA